MPHAKCDNNSNIANAEPTDDTDGEMAEESSTADAMCGEDTDSAMPALQTDSSSDSGLEGWDSESE